MKLYADLPARRMVQICGDVLLVLWVLLWVRIANTVHDATLGLAKPGREVESSARGLAQKFTDMAGSVSGIPMVGDDVRKPFDGARGAAIQLAAAGHSQVEAVGTLAHWLGIAVAAIPIVVLAAWYLPARVRFVRRASAGKRFLDSADDLDLFALRAMTNQPLHVLGRVSADPAGAWRRGDREVIDRLARIELASSGLRPPRSV